MWNNKGILIDKQPVFWKSWYDQKVIFINDLLNDSGGILSFNRFKENITLKIMFLQYHQITSAILPETKVCWHPKTYYDFTNLFFLFENKSINFEEFRCKHFYQLFMENSICVPTAINSWREETPVVANSWDSAIVNTYQFTSDNKLRQFSFKLFHRVLVTKKDD